MVGEQAQVPVRRRMRARWSLAIVACVAVVAVTTSYLFVANGYLPLGEVRRPARTRRREACSSSR